MLELRQSTAITLKIGPALDDTDGKTAETLLTIAQADVRLSKNGGDIAQKHEATSCTHDELGIYGCPLDTDDTDTLGRFQLWVHKSGVLPIWHEYMVLTQQVWDSKYSTDRLQVDVREKGDANLALTTQEKADANTEADTALSDYDPPTKTEMDNGLAGLNDLSAAQVNAEVDTALSDYDPPTKAEMDTAHALLATAAALATAQTDLDNPGQYKADISALALQATLLTVAGYLDTEIAAIITALATAQADLDNPSQYKADVSGLATAAALATASINLACPARSVSKGKRAFRTDPSRTPSQRV